MGESVVWICLLLADFSFCECFVFSNKGAANIINEDRTQLGASVPIGYTDMGLTGTLTV